MTSMREGSLATPRGELECCEMDFGGFDCKTTFSQPLKNVYATNEMCLDTSSKNTISSIMYTIKFYVNKHIICMNLYDKWNPTVLIKSTESYRW